MKSKLKLEEFTKYCESHPEERFWQALRNWSGFAKILVTNGLHVLPEERLSLMFDPVGTRDTFYDE